MTDHTETARHLLDRHGLPEDVIDGALALHIQEVTALVRAEADKPRQLIESRMARNVRRIRYRQVADLIEAAALGVPLAAAPAEPKADRLVPGGHPTRHHPPTRRTDMTQPTITDLRRELEKAQIALIAALKHLGAHAEMNAALHCADRVMYSPLHAKIENAIDGIDHALARTAQTEPATQFARSLADTQGLVKILTDLDRCQHGRHQGDPCGPADDCNGTSAGNPHLRPGQVIGYDLRADPIVMPDRDHKHDPKAWRTQPEQQP